jgi:hypothetical protein
MNEEPRLQLNPGSSHKLKASDYCFYIGEFKEEFSKIKCPNVIQEDISPKDSAPATRKNKSLGQ